MAQPSFQGQFIWHELLCNDTSAATAFYERILPWKAQPFSPGSPYLMFRSADGKAIAGAMRLSDEAKAAGTGPHWRGYIGAADVDAIAGQAVGLGARIQQPVQDVPGVGRVALLTDPEGATFGLYSPLVDSGSALASSSFSWSELAVRNREAALGVLSAAVWLAIAPTHGHGRRFLLPDVWPGARILAAPTRFRRIGPCRPHGAPTRAAAAPMRRPARLWPPAASWPMGLLRFRAADASYSSLIWRAHSLRCIRWPLPRRRMQARRNPRSRQIGPTGGEKDGQKKPPRKPEKGEGEGEGRRRSEGEGEGEEEVREAACRQASEKVGTQTRGEAGQESEAQASAEASPCGQAQGRAQEIAKPGAATCRRPGRAWLGHRSRCNPRRSRRLPPAGRD